MTRDADFVSNRLPLLDRGFIYAIASVRGGGDMGRKWYGRVIFHNPPSPLTNTLTSRRDWETVV